MAHAYTPGLKVTESTIVKKVRRLPLPGEILVKKGEKVDGDRIVAKTALPGKVSTVNVAGLLGVPPGDVPSAMLKKIGEPVERDEVIAESKGFFGLFKSTVKAPVKGILENISAITGQVILREPPQPVEVSAYIDGEVVEIFPKEGVAIQALASFIQGIFGIGGETRGKLILRASSPKDILTASSIDDFCKDKIIIGGSLIDYSGLIRAKEVKAKGVIVGGVEDESLKRFLGYDIGVAITGGENKGLTLVVTEGFGRVRMVDKTFGLLSSLEGKLASMSGATQIRAGVIRPEVIVPATDHKKSKKLSLTAGMDIGTPVRVIREPYFGLLGKVTALPTQLQRIETESKVRVLEVELENGKRITLPRANVEIIEE